MRKPDFCPIELLVLDFDGVLTDGYTWVNPQGEEMARCSHKDGQGIRDLARAGFPVIVLSGQTSLYVKARCEKLKVKYYQSINDKASMLKDIVRDDFPDISLEDVCYVGDDRNDIGAMNIVGLPVAVANAVPETKVAAEYITERGGGDHAVREICDEIMKAKGWLP